MNSDATGTRSSGLNLGASGSPSSSHYPRYGPAGAPPIAHRMGSRSSSGGSRVGSGVGYNNSSGNINHNGGSFGHHGVRGSPGLGGGGWEGNRGRNHLERDRQPLSPSLSSSAVTARKWERDRDRDTDRDRDGVSGPDHEWGGRGSNFMSTEKARYSPGSGGMSKTGDDEEAKRKKAEAVAEEARAFAERERRLAEKSDEVCVGVY